MALDIYIYVWRAYCVYLNVSNTLEIVFEIWMAHTNRMEPMCQSITKLNFRLDVHMNETGVHVTSTEQFVLACGSRQSLAIYIYYTVV